METLKYIIEDKTIVEILGLQNFTTEESAILELVKNAYDANATTLLLDFSNDSLVIKDNGIGMDESDIKNHWMRVGYSNKGYRFDSNNNSRILAGSMGIGRFALSRLGGDVVIKSKKNNFPGVIWKTDWENSFLSTDETNNQTGTSIIITSLRQKWSNEKIVSLVQYLSRAYNDDAMTITVIDLNHESTIISNCFPKPILGINCLYIINLEYTADQTTLKTSIVADEFKTEAKTYCENINLTSDETLNNMYEELSAAKDYYDNQIDIKEELQRIGDFKAEFYFNQRPSKNDVERFCYKYLHLPESIKNGIILYRNAFSISSFEGSKDWLGLGKRARKSPASPSHPTGAWRVRENQFSGKIIIDKLENINLKDLSNRQGLEENIQFELFLQILHTGISNFERYRQSIVREINRNKNKEEKGINTNTLTPISDKVARSPDAASKLSVEEVKQLAEEIKIIKEGEAVSKKEREEVEDRYKYDVRILNALSTIGLKASSIAHEMRNDRSVISSNTDYIIKALKEYGFWELLNDNSRTKIKYKNVPSLLSDNKRVADKLIAFMDTMLSDIQKKKFIASTSNISEIIENIKYVWERDYSWVKIIANLDLAEKVQVHEDTIRVILDNLILNSIQQNQNSDSLIIRITIKESNDVIEFEYSDNGVGLNSKYADNPNKILEVHETTRKNGHGLGMWIVNNTVNMHGGEITNISQAPGFSISFFIGADGK